MRTLRLLVTGTSILVLITGVTGIALAQDPKATNLTHVTGETNMDDIRVETEPYGATVSDDSVEYQGEWIYTLPMEWSDSRLGETMRVREHAMRLNGDPDDAEDDMFVHVRAVRLDAPDGAWVGSALGATNPQRSLTLYELTGEGAYEGLSALFGQENSESPVQRFDGWIFEGDLPPMPEPVEPLAE